MEAQWEEMLAGRADSWTPASRPPGSGMGPGEVLRPACGGIGGTTNSNKKQLPGTLKKKQMGSWKQPIGLLRTVGSHVSRRGPDKDGKDHLELRSAESRQLVAAPIFSRFGLNFTMATCITLLSVTGIPLVVRNIRGFRCWSPVLSTRSTKISTR